MITAEAKVKKVVIKKSSGEIEFAGIDLRADEVRKLSIYAKDKDRLILSVGNNIQVGAKLEKITSSAKGDEPKFIEMVFTGGHYEILAGMAKSEEIITIAIEPDSQGKFGFMDSDTEAD